MNKKEAAELIGTETTVSAWTAMNGEYVGKLVEVIARPRQPWRGKVQITGVKEPAAFEWKRGDRQRKGFRIGDIIEVGGINIRVTEEAGTNYLVTLKNDLAKVKEWLERDPDNTLYNRIVSWRETQIAEEEEYYKGKMAGITGDRPSSRTSNREQYTEGYIKGSEIRTGYLMQGDTEGLRKEIDSLTNK